MSSCVIVEKCARTGVDFDGKLQCRSNVDHTAHADPQTNTKSEDDRTESGLRLEKNFSVNSLLEVERESRGTRKEKTTSLKF